MSDAVAGGVGFFAGVAVMVTNWLLLSVIVRRWLGSFHVEPLLVDESATLASAGDDVVAAYGSGEALPAENAGEGSADVAEDEAPAPMPQERRSKVRYFALLLMPLKIAYIGALTYLCLGLLKLPAPWYVGGAVVGLGVVTALMVLWRERG